MLKATAGKLGVTLTGKLRTCEGSAVRKGLRYPIDHKATYQSAKILGRVFVDIREPKGVLALGKSGMWFISVMTSEGL